MGRKTLRFAWISLGGCLVCWMISICSPRDAGVPCFGLAALVAGLAAVLSLVSLTAKDRSVAGGVIALILSCIVGCLSLLGVVATGMGAPGRRLRVAGIRRLPRVRRGPRGVTSSSREDAPIVRGMDANTRRMLAKLWLADARAEHASVAAFERLAAELVAIEAPSNLVDWARRAALEEVGHAALCFTLASAYADRELSAAAQPAFVSAIEIAPRPASSRTAAIERLALESLVDGCIEEGLAARMAEVGAIHAEDPVIAKVLGRIACEEASHAALAYAVVQWAIEEEPSTLQALDRAMARRSPQGPTPDASEGLLTRGRVGTGGKAVLMSEVEASVKNWRDAIASDCETRAAYGRLRGTPTRQGVY